MMKDGKVSYAEWLLNGTCENPICLEDKIEQMPVIEDLVNGMQPEIEISNSYGKCKIIYCHPVGQYDYFYIWAENVGRRPEEEKKFIQWHAYFKDLKEQDIWTSLIRSNAKRLLETVSPSMPLAIYDMRLSITNVFYNLYDREYFLDLPRSGE